MGQVQTADGRYHAELHRLVDKGRAAQVGREADIDWTLAPKLPIWLPRKAIAHAVGEIHCGELATATMCRNIMPRIGDADARAFLATQAEDEQRHARHFQRYLQVLGLPVPTTSAVQGIYDDTIAYDGPPEAQIVAFHVILENENLRAQGVFNALTDCALLRNIGRSVHRDEARHLAFGRLYLQRALQSLSLAQRQEIYTWLRDLWFAAFDAIARKTTVAGVSLMRLSGVSNAEAMWAERVQDLEAIGLFSLAECRMMGTA